MNSYGGFLPLELNKGAEYFADYEGSVLRYNSGKAAIIDVIKHVLPTKIYLPRYYCPSTTSAIMNAGIEVSYYHLGPDLMPESIPDNEGELVLLVDYFGVKTADVDKLSGVFNKAYVIIDKCHAFFSTPIMRSKVYNAYSAKKFIGVPDGSYLISLDANWNESPMTYASSYSSFLLTAYEEGTNAAYSAKKEADKTIAANYGGMSYLAKGILRNTDYSYIKEQRKKNYLALQEELSEINELKLPDACSPYHYPLLIRGKGSMIKRKLVENKIYVPTLWGDIDLPVTRNEFENEMSENCVFIPLDQRYNENDMKYIIGKIKEFINA